ncbi:hypothetical protein COT98_02800 [Candidatus Falkowbacteria bacterium CG10_big_fil_rev_8_21_14_0_10_39_9]|uniref:Uncharacterized protein n=1 Tax=Candidatus Falkowbacteria bacterium CG10_big_fil_rev_8_21_14_0_10_39_9 TaxID=1974566 RepID=A0A2M6WPB0_9BACT|nr:MAG: hypothetical protein COT98_02800 [Candidatus Falkowbacteria bacterium CG10_big_fil_rev_8_21_14_0_10_39_9]
MTEKKKKVSKALPKSKKIELQYANVTIFVLECDSKRISVPAKYCAVDTMAMFKRLITKGKRSTSFRFVGHDSINPVDYIGKRIRFLGPKVKKGETVSYPAHYSDARHLTLKSKYKIIDVRRKK